MLIDIINAIDQRSGNDAIAGFGFESPIAGTELRGYSLELRGWIAGWKEAVKSLAIYHQGELLLTLDVDQARPDILNRLGDVPQQNCGFLSGLALLGLPREVRLEVKATLTGGGTSSVCAMDIKRSPVKSPDAMISPIMLTGLGRSGTTLAMATLAGHPEIVAYKGYPYEARVASYNMAIANMLLTIQSIQKLIPPAQMNPYWGITPPAMAGSMLPYPARDIFNGVFDEQKIAMCVNTIDGVYAELGAAQNKPRLKYCIEKVLSNRLPAQIREIYPNAKEILLVRDFRDTFCSIKAFNKKRGYLSFNMQAEKSDQDYILGLKAQTEKMLNRWKSDNDRLHLLRYEDLITRPYETLRGLLNFLGLDASPSVIGRMINEADEVSKATALLNHKTTVSSRDSIGRWRSYEDAEVMDFFNAQFSAILPGFGYPLEGYQIRDEEDDQGLKLDIPALNITGEELFGKGQFNEAVEVFTQLVGLVSDSPEYWNNLGVSLAALSRIDEARECFTLALSYDPTFQDAMKNIEAIAGK